MPISNLKKQKCYIEVDVNEELPGISMQDANKEIYVTAKDFDEGVIENAYFEPKDKSWWISFTGIRLTNVTHWFKPLENRYILTEEDLKQIIYDLKFKDKDYKKMKEPALSAAVVFNMRIDQYVKSLNL